MNNEIVSQELSDEQLELVTGGHGGPSTIINIYFVTVTNISNSVLVDSPVDSLNTSSALVNTSADSFNGTGRGHHR